MIVTLKVKLGSSWSADIELPDSFTLEQLHYAIQHAVDFDDDHLYCFMVGRSDRDRNAKTYDDENGKLISTRICDIFPLPEKQRLIYLFDYGDYWLFNISKSRKKPHQPEDGIEYPRVVKETGEKPEQYEYPDDDC